MHMYCIIRDHGRKSRVIDSSLFDDPHNQRTQLQPTRHHQNAKRGQRSLLD